MSVKWGPSIGGFGDVPEYSKPYPYQYDIEIVPEGGDCNSPAADCRYQTNIKYTSYTFAPKAPKLQMRIRNYKAFCGLAGAWSPWYHFTVTGMNFLTGTVYSDPGGQAVMVGNKCQLTGQPDYGTAGVYDTGLVIDKPGLYGEYFNAYPVGYGPPSSDNQQGYALLSGTPRTRWDMDLKFVQYHGFLNQTGTQDGPGWSARWTGTVTPYGPAFYGNTLYYDMNWYVWSYWGVNGGYRVYVDNALVINAWPMFPAGNTPTGSIALTRGQKYQLRVEIYQLSYNSDLYIGGVLTNYRHPYVGSGFFPGAGSVVNTQDALSSSSTNVGADGSYSQNTTNVSTGTVTLVPAGYQCTCPAGCTYSGISDPTLGLNYYVSLISPNWYQIMGGDVTAGGTAGTTFKNPIPPACTSPACSPYPLISIPGGGNEQVGALLTVEGTLSDVSDQTGSQESPVGPAGANYPVKLTSSIACKENYDYFYRLYSMGTSPQDDFVLPTNNPNSAQKPTQPPVNTGADGASKGAYYHNGDLIIDQNWTLGATESIVIFVNGSLTITNSANITVPNGAFLAFIIKEGITFDPTIGTTDETSTTGTIQGIYIANQGITVESVGASPSVAEKKFVCEGTLVACGNITTLRDFRNSPNAADGSKNSSYPASLFIFRPDFVTNTPDKMKQPMINWKEIAP